MPIKCSVALPDSLETIFFHNGAYVYIGISWQSIDFGKHEMP